MGKNRKKRNRRAIAYKGMICVILMFCILFIGNAAFAKTKMPAFDAAEGVYIIDPDTEDIFAKQHETEHYYPASTTKILTALIAMDYVADRLTEQVTIGPEIMDIDIDSSVANLTENDTYTWEQLLYGLMLPSGNDAAMTIAVNIAKLQTGNDLLETTEAIGIFADLMNKKASAVGATDSHFVNPHGLHDAAHYTTPKDMMCIARVAFDNATIATIAKTVKYVCTSGDGVTQEWTNSNLLLCSIEEMKESAKEELGFSGNTQSPYYSSYARSGKTGHDEEAGRCLVFTGENGEMTLYGVIFKSRDLKTINTEAKAALDTGVTEYTHFALHGPEESFTIVTALWGSILDGFSLDLNTDAFYTLTVPKDEETTLTKEIVYDERYLKADEDYVIVKGAFEANTQVATLEVKGETYHHSVPLFAGKAMKPIGVVDYLIIGGAVVVIFLIILAIVLIVKKKKKANLRLTEMM